MYTASARDTCLERFVLDGPDSSNPLVLCLLLWPWFIVSLAYFTVLGILYAIILPWTGLYTYLERVYLAWQYPERRS